MKNSINNKLVAGFGLCVLLTVALVWFNLSALKRLEILFQQTVKRSVDVELATDAQHIGEDLYLVVANAVINRDMAKRERDWNTAKIESQAKLKKVAMAVENPEEQARMREVATAFAEIIRIYEQEMLPLILKGAVVPGPLSDIDARIDTHIEAIDRTLEAVAKSISDENQKAAQEFHNVLDDDIRLVIFISLFGVGAALCIAALTIRLIVRPLSEITRAAMEVEKGNYHVEITHRATDEAGVLANAFRKMAAEVGKRTTELRDSNVRLQVEMGERTAAEEEIRRLNVDLSQRVQERTIELVFVNEHLQQMFDAQKEAEVELRRSREELRNLSRHLQAVREDDRASIAREIHDELGQSLTALKMDVSWLKGKLPAENRQIIEKAEGILRSIDMTIKTVQEIAAELRPAMLDDLGLTAAIEWQAQEFQKRSGIVCEVACDFDSCKLDRGRSTALFRIFQETLTNIYRHADATQVQVSLVGKDNELIATVTDNGKGISKIQLLNPKSLGIIGMRERARCYGGELSINRLPEGGTCVQAIIPLDGGAKEILDDPDTHCG